MLPDLANGGWSAFLVGLIVSPHCVGMCGPLYCSFIPIRHTRSLETFQLSYHLGRVFAYTLIGALAASISLAFFKIFDWNLTVYLPWLLIVFLILFALGIDKLIFRGRFPGMKLQHRLVRSSRILPGELGTFTLGLFTPVLPCAPLYTVLWVALISGSPIFGAQLMLGFSLGTIPLLWVSQSQFLRHRDKWSSKSIQVVQRSLAAIAAVVLIVRMIWIGGPLDGGACFAT